MFLFLDTKIHLFLVYFLLWCSPRLYSQPSTLRHVHYPSQYSHLFPFHWPPPLCIWHSALFLFPPTELWLKHFSTSKRSSTTKYVGLQNQHFGIFFEIEKWYLSSYCTKPFNFQLFGSYNFGNVVVYDQVQTVGYFMLTDISKIESVQRSFTKRLPGLSNLPYTKRLEVLGIDSLEIRRLRYHLFFLCTKCYLVLFV